MNLTNFQQLVTRLLIGLETRPECADADPLGPELYWHGTTRTVDGSVADPGDRGRRATKYSFHLVSLTQLFYGDRAAGHNCRAVANGSSSICVDYANLVTELQKESPATPSKGDSGSPRYTFCAGRLRSHK
jgi:hypothetical protein